MGVVCPSLAAAMGMRGGAREKEGRRLCISDISGRITGVSECAVTTVEMAVREVFDPRGTIDSADKDLFRLSVSAEEGGGRESEESRPAKP